MYRPGSPHYAKKAPISKTFKLLNFPGIVRFGSSKVHSWLHFKNHFFVKKTPNPNNNTLKNRVLHQLYKLLTKNLKIIL